MVLSLLAVAIQCPNFGSGGPLVTMLKFNATHLMDGELLIYRYRFMLGMTFLGTHTITHFEFS